MAILTISAVVSVSFGRVTLYPRFSSSLRSVSSSKSASECDESGLLSDSGILDRRGIQKRSFFWQCGHIIASRLIFSLQYGHCLTVLFSG